MSLRETSLLSMNHLTEGVDYDTVYVLNQFNRGEMYGLDVITIPLPSLDLPKGAKYIYRTGKDNAPKMYFKKQLDGSSFPDLKKIKIVKPSSGNIQFLPPEESC